MRCPSQLKKLEQNDLQLTRTAFCGDADVHEDEGKKKLIKIFSPTLPLSQSTV